MKNVTDDDSGDSEVDEGEEDWFRQGWRSVTFNDLDRSRARISRSFKFSVANSTELAVNIPHKANILWVGRLQKT